MKKQLPVYLGFFAMGFVDVVGISANYAKKEFQLRDSVANLLPLMVFAWFALFSVPTGVWMNRVGRRRTVLLGLGITLTAMLAAPVSGRHFLLLLLAFAFLGIGNTILQVALNPLLVNVTASSRLSSALTGGQLIKALASFLGPVIAGWASTRWGDWKIIFWIMAGFCVLNLVWLWMTPISEGLSAGEGSAAAGELPAAEGLSADEASAAEGASAARASVRESLALLADPVIFYLFIGVVCIVGLDVGLNTTLPTFMMYRCGLPLEKAGLGTSLYFIARTVGSLAGIFLLAKIPGRRLLVFTAVLGLAAVGGLLLSSGIGLIGTFILLIGLAVANVFPLLFAFALDRVPLRQNDVSGLLIMGVAGGAILLPIMGLVEDFGGPVWALAFLLLPWAYLVWLRRRVTAGSGQSASAESLPAAVSPHSKGGEELQGADHD